MEKTLREMIQEKLKNPDPYEVCTYFATDFAEDYEKFEQDKSNIPALEYLNDAFIDIDTEDYGTDNFADVVKSTLNAALKML